MSRKRIPVFRKNQKLVQMTYEPCPKCGSTLPHSNLSGPCVVVGVPTQKGGRVTCER